MVKIDIPMPKTCKDCPIIISAERSSKERMPTRPLIEVKDDD